MTEFMMQYLPFDHPLARPVLAFMLLSIRYFVIAGAAFLVFYTFRPTSKIYYRKIQQRIAKSSEFKREIFYSIATFMVFAIMIFIIRNPALQPYTQLYLDISEKGWPYFIASIVIMIVLHDTYFYWAHRLMHHPKIYPIFHKVHHLSTNPSPWASFSFHPLEAVVEFGIVPFFVFLLPCHPAALIIFSFFMMIENVIGHVGYEIFPKNWNKYFITKWINTSTNHNMHHQYFKGNYGLYFTFWDRIMGTLHPQYEQRFEEVSGMEKPHLQEDNFPAEVHHT